MLLWNIYFSNYKAEVHLFSFHHVSYEGVKVIHINIFIYLWEEKHLHFSPT